MQAARDIRLALLCGLCPTRRVLGHLTLWPDADLASNPVVMPVEVKHRKQRPSVATRSRIAAPGEPREWRCRLGHMWSFRREELRDVCLAAVKAGRREIIAGVDIKGTAGQSIAHGRDTPDTR
jgi:hypothetical protein